MVERPGVRGLDHRPVGHRIAVGDAQLEQAAAAGGQTADHLGREIQVGIAGGDEGHESLAAGGAKLAERVSMADMEAEDEGGIRICVSPLPLGEG